MLSKKKKELEIMQDLLDSKVDANRTWSFSHRLVMRTSPPHVKRQEMMKTDELEFKAYVESIAYIQIQTLRDS